MSDHNLAEALRNVLALIDDLVELDGADIREAREALAAHEAELQTGEAVAWALLFHGDPRLCLSTVFDSYAEAINYVVTRVSGPAEIVPLFTHPQQPLTREQCIKLWGDRSDGPSNGEIVSFTRAIEAAHGITKDTK